MPSRLAALALVLALLLAGCGGTNDVNQRPQAIFTVTPGAAGTYVLDASASRDPEGGALTYAWDYVVGTATGRVAEVSVPTQGNATLAVVLVVRDPEGNIGATHTRDAIKIGTGENKNPAIRLADASRWVKPGSTITLDAGPTRDPDGDAVTYEWIWGPYIDFDPTVSDHGDPLTSQNTVAQTFNSGSMRPAATFNQTFDKPGTYNYVCHPHPWMTGRVIVDPAANGSGALVRIEGYAFADETVRIAPNGTVTWTNFDVDMHTASALDYTPGLLAGGTGVTFTQTPSEGKHVVRVIATDDKGGRFTASYGLLVSADAPPPTRTLTTGTDPQQPESLARAGAAGAGAVAPIAAEFQLNYTANISGVLTWEDPSRGAAVKGHVELLHVKGTDPAAVTCPGSLVAGSAEYRFGCRHESELGQKYRLRVVADEGVMDWSLTTSITEYHSAGFGDYNAERCHLEPGGAVHCF